MLRLQQFRIRSAIQLILVTALCSGWAHAITFRYPDGSEAEFSEGYVKNALFNTLLETPMFLETLKAETKTAIEDFIQAEFSKSRQENSFIQNNFDMLNTELQQKQKKHVAALYPNIFGVSSKQNPSKTIISQAIFRIIDYQAVQDNRVLKRELQNIFYEYCSHAHESLQSSTQESDAKRDQGFEWFVAAHRLPEVKYLSITLTPGPAARQTFDIDTIRNKDMGNQEFDILTSHGLIEVKYSLGTSQTWYTILNQLSREFAWQRVCQALLEYDIRELNIRAPELTQQDTRYQLPIPDKLKTSNNKRYLMTNYVKKENTPHATKASHKWRSLIEAMDKPLYLYTRYDKNAEAFCNAITHQHGLQITNPKASFVEGLTFHLRFIDHNAAYNVKYDARNNAFYGYPE